MEGEKRITTPPTISTSNFPLYISFSVEVLQMARGCVYALSETSWNLAKQNGAKIGLGNYSKHSHKWLVIVFLQSQRLPETK